MTNISKILAVFVTVVSLAFMGAVFVGSAGGMNFETETKHQTLSSIRFESKYDEATGKTLWSAQTISARRDPNNATAKFEVADVGKDEANLPKLVVDAQKRVETDHRNKSKQLDADIKAVTFKIKKTKDTVKVDMLAMERRLTELKTQLEKRRTFKKTQQARVAKLQLDAISDREKALRRSDDVERIRDQIDEIDGEIYRLAEQQKKLVVYIDAMKGTIERLENRLKKIETRQGQ